MAQDRTALRTTAVVERRPVAATTIHRSAASAAAPSPARALQQRIGNQAVQALVARTVAPATAPAALGVSVVSPTGVQRAARISSPNDPAELEARDAARKVVAMAPPVPAIAADPKGLLPTVHRSANSAAPSPSAAAVGPIGAVGGSPLPGHVRSFMEPRFGANFDNVRIHTGDAAAQHSADLNAHAFTVGEHVFFGRNQYQPESAGGRELIAHELTHTIQQGASVQRSADTTVSQRTPPRVQRFGIGDALDGIADKANYIPGFRLLTIVLGTNPVNLKPVERSAANILRGLLELIPVTGALIAEALENHGIFARVGAWAETQVRSLGMVGSALKGALDKFLDSLSWGDIFDLGGVWERAKRIFTEPIDRLIAFGKGLATDILHFIREAILLPLARLAEGTRGYDLLKAVLGEDPVTGQPCPRNAETLIGGFMKLIGQEEVWENAKKSNAAARAWAWFQSALTGLMGFVKQIPALVVAAFKALEIIDMILVPRAFLKIAGVFGNFILQFITWAGNTVWNLLEIIFDVVSPGALGYIKKTGAALKSILKNPLPFVGNLVKAAKQGFLNFADHFLDHLKAGLIDWLTGSLPGIYIPKAFSLTEIAKFVFSVLGLSWANIRQKLVKATSETVVKALETGFDIVVTLVREGPAAAWDKIKEQLSNLKDMVIGGITDFVVDMVVKKAIPKLIAMFIPGAGFISAILSIYDTIMVFVNKISKIIQVVKGFIDSIVAIASGAIGAAATRVETTLAGLLSLAINFLAGFAGLGKVADKVMAVLEKVRAPIDKALDWLVNWIVTMAKKLGKMVAQAGVPADPNERLKLGMKAAVDAANRFAGKKVGALVLSPLLAAIKVRYGFKSLDVVPQGANWAIRGQINPETIAFTRVIVGTDKDTGAATSVTIVENAKVIDFEFRRFTANQSVSINEMTEGLQHHQTALNELTVDKWLANIYFRPFLRGAIAAEERDFGRKQLIADLRAEITAEYKKSNRPLSSAELARLVILRARGKHASHSADFISGGDIDKFDSLERGAVNSYIGSNWGRLRPELEAYAILVRQLFEPKDREKIRMNFRLRAKFLN